MSTELLIKGRGSLLNLLLVLSESGLHGELLSLLVLGQIVVILGDEGASWCNTLGFQSCVLSVLNVSLISLVHAFLHSVES